VTNQLPWAIKWPVSEHMRFPRLGHNFKLGSTWAYDVFACWRGPILLSTSIRSSRFGALLIVVVFGKLEVCTVYNVMWTLMINL
jgi:hypothetical protein